MKQRGEHGLRVTFLGTGTSQGVPRLGCECAVCQSEDSRDKRTRCSVYIQTPEKDWVIDTGPDFRTQCLREKVKKVEAAVYTHGHTDHVMGFDDLRPFAQRDALFPIYGSAQTLTMLANAFVFAFRPEVKFPGYLYPEANEVTGPFWIGETELEPMRLPHGSVTSFGYLLRRNGEPLFAYLTDCQSVPEEVVEAVSGVRHLVLDALREKPHPTHMNVEQALVVAEKVGAGATWLTHLCHDLSHAALEAKLPVGVRIAFDGLCLDI